MAQTPNQNKTKPACKDVIDACNKAIADYDVVLYTSKQATVDAQKENAMLHTQVDKLQESNTAWYHNPIIMSVFGIAAGVVISKTVLFK